MYISIDIGQEICWRQSERRTGREERRVIFLFYIPILYSHSRREERRAGREEEGKRGKEKEDEREDRRVRKERRERRGGEGEEGREEEEGEVGEERSEERGGGKECAAVCRSRWARDH